MIDTIMCVTSTKNDSGVITINIGERFTFDSHVGFRDAYQNVEKNSDYIINLTNTVYMDSSALGMMLLIREHNGTKNTIKVKGCTKNIINIFELVNFKELFDFI